MILESIHLRDIAYARSGDKGENANIAVIGYTQEGYEFLREHLRKEVVQDFFKPLGVVDTLRYELPNLLALNFVLKGVLAGGASLNLRVDAQGKALGQALLEMKMAIAEDLLCRCRK